MDAGMGGMQFFFFYFEIFPKSSIFAALNKYYYKELYAKDTNGFDVDAVAHNDSNHPRHKIQTP